VVTDEQALTSSAEASAVHMNRGAILDIFNPLSLHLFCLAALAALASRVQALPCLSQLCTEAARAA
jgi:hypothetical protein